MVREPDITSIREHVVQSLCEVRGNDRADLDREIDAHGGDLRIDSKEGEAICAIVEDILGVGELVEAADLEPEVLTSIDSLTRLFEERLKAHHSDEGKDAA